LSYCTLICRITTTQYLITARYVMLRSGPLKLAGNKRLSQIKTLKKKC